MTLEEIKLAIEKINKHNEDQRVIIRMNEPQHVKLREWVDQFVNADESHELYSIIQAVRKYLNTHKDLDGTRTIIKEHLITIVREKMEELDAYKY